MSDTPQYFYDPIVVPSDSNMSLPLRFKQSNDQLGHQRADSESLPKHPATVDPYGENRDVVQDLPTTHPIQHQFNPPVRCSVCETQSGSDAYVRALTATSHYYAGSQSVSPLMPGCPGYGQSDGSYLSSANANVNPASVRYQSASAPYNYEPLLSTPVGQHGVLVPSYNATSELESLAQSDMYDSSDDDSDTDSMDSGFLVPRYKAYDLEYEPDHLEADLNLLQEAINDASINRGSADYQDNTTWEFDRINNLISCLTSHVETVFAEHYKRQKKGKKKARDLHDASQPRHDDSAEDSLDLFDEFQAAQILLRYDRTCRVYLCSDKIIKITRAMYFHDCMFSSPCVIYDFLTAIGTSISEDTVYGIANREQEQDLWEGLQKWRPSIDPSTLKEGTIAHCVNRFVNSTQTLMKRVKVVKRKRSQHFETPEETDPNPPLKRLASGPLPQYVPDYDKRSQKEEPSIKAVIPDIDQVSRNGNYHNPLRTSRRDHNGIRWEVVPSKDHDHMEYTIRCDIDSVDITQLSQKFKSENCIYPHAYVTKEQRKGIVLDYESNCIEIGWALADLNPCLRARLSLLQHAVEWCFTGKKDAFPFLKFGEKSSTKPVTPAEYDYETQLLLLENQSMHRFIQAKLEHVKQTKHQIPYFPRQSDEKETFIEHVKPQPPPMPRKDTRKKIILRRTGTDGPLLGPTSEPNNHALQDFQTQLRLLEQQNQKRLLCVQSPHRPDYATQLKKLEEMNRKRLLLKQQEEERQRVKALHYDWVKQEQQNPASPESSEPVTYQRSHVARDEPCGRGPNFIAPSCPPFIYPKVHRDGEPLTETMFRQQATQANWNTAPFSAPPLPPQLPLPPLAPKLQPGNPYFMACNNGGVGAPMVEYNYSMCKYPAFPLSAGGQADITHVEDCSSSSSATFGTQIWSPHLLPNEGDGMSDPSEQPKTNKKSSEVEMVIKEEEDDDVTIAGDSDVDDDDDDDDSNDNQWNVKAALPRSKSYTATTTTIASPTPSGSDSSSSSDDYVLVGAHSDRETSSDSEFEGMHMVVAPRDYEWE